ncbi:MAG: hypothetical protein LBN95_03810 [Prevotellaceae bacterium]|jgi:hypothetical protein|nr:hypothetical protein [Prevotellaceae bacterium]
MKKINIFKISAIIIVLVMLCSCKKEDYYIYRFINATDEDVLFVYIGKSVDMFHNVGIVQDGVHLLFDSELFNDSSVVFRYKGTFYEERTLSDRSILRQNNHLMFSSTDTGQIDCIYVIMNSYILSLPEVEAAYPEY